MSRRALRPHGTICQFCDYLSARQSLSRPRIRSRQAIDTAGTSSSARRIYSQARSLGSSVHQKAELPSESLHTNQKRIRGAHLNQTELERAISKVKIICQSILASERAPTEQETIRALAECEILADQLLLDSPTPPVERKDGAASALLSLDDSSSKKVANQKSPPAIQHMVEELSTLAYSMIRHPPVFITPEALERYVHIQATLRKPRTLPEVFNLYANKPLPEEGSSPTKYTKQKPNKVANAVPVSVADQALQAAIDAKQLLLAMDIIESSYTTTAFHRAKFVRKGLLPATGLAVAPVAAYTIASQLALLQHSMDSHMATNVAFAGILAYVGFTATIGVVAVTTANDQMDRVTWAQGLPLRERWIREEERAAMDRVAGSWGFKESWRRGEEEGEEWDALREWIGRKGMMLDRVELMEGME